MIAMSYFIAEKSQGGSGWVFVIVVAIWIVFSIVSAIAKKQDEERRRRVRQQIATGLPPSAMPSYSPPPPGPQPMQRPPEIFQPQMQRATVAKSQTFARQQDPRNSSQQRQQQQQHQQPQQRSGKKRKAASRTAPPPIPQGEEIVRSVVQTAEIRAGGDAKQAKPIAVNAESLHEWLRPATLRQQFMLTEVLQPPVALRPDRY